MHADLESRTDECIIGDSGFTVEAYGSGLLKIWGLRL